MAKKNNKVNETNTATATTVVANKPALSLEEQLKGACDKFTSELGSIMNCAMQNTRNARDIMLGAVADYREQVKKQDNLAGIIHEVGATVLDMGDTHLAEVETYETTLDILDELEVEVASVDGEIVDEDCDYEITDETADEVAEEEEVYDITVDETADETTND